MSDTMKRLIEAVERLQRYIPCGTVECRGDKCREPWCISCCGQDEAEAYMAKINADARFADEAVRLGLEQFHAAR